MNELMLCLRRYLNILKRRLFIAGGFISDGLVQLLVTFSTEGAIEASCKPLPIRVNLREC